MTERTHLILLLRPRNDFQGNTSFYCIANFSFLPPNPFVQRIFFLIQAVHTQGKGGQVLTTPSPLSQAIIFIIFSLSQFQLSFQQEIIAAFSLYFLSVRLLYYLVSQTSLQKTRFQLIMYAQNFHRISSNCKDVTTNSLSCSFVNRGLNHTMLFCICRKLTRRPFAYGTCDRPPCHFPQSRKISRTSGKRIISPHPRIGEISRPLRLCGLFFAAAIGTSPMG